MDIAGNGVEVRTREPLHLHEGLTVAVAFDKGFVHEPTAANKLALFFRSNWPLGIPIAAFVAMFYLWWTRGRDPRLRPIAAQYEPPDQLTPGEVGTLVDNSADMRDITASIVDLAVRGYIVIEEHRRDRMLGLMHDKDYNFIVQKDRGEWVKLKPHEQALLGVAFSDHGYGWRVGLDVQPGKSVLYKLAAASRATSFPRSSPTAITAGLSRIASVPRTSPPDWGCHWLSFWYFGGLEASRSVRPWHRPALTFVIAGILTGVDDLRLWMWFMPAHTEQGARALEGVLGFEDFLVHVESDRFNRTIKTPEMFEKFLPFAMALGVEKNWSRAFQGIMTQPPQWYRGSSYGPNFYPMMFTNDLGSMSSRAGSVLASAPRSSGGSGFSK